MFRKKEITHRLRTVCAGLASALLIMLFAVILLSPGFVYAEGETSMEAPIREAHNVGIGTESYCFFVTRNVVLTPAEIAEMSDKELTSAILTRAGLYMRKTNCTAASHKTITVENWTRNEGSFLLSEPDIKDIRMADPVDGRPVKFYMDLIVSLQPEGDSEDEEGDEPEEEPGEDPDEDTTDEPEGDTEDDPEDDPEDIPLYSTFKRTGPSLLFAVVATEADAKLGEDICKDNSRPGPGTYPGAGRTDASDDEMLPENRTVTLVDRTGAPIKPTLEEGDPVDLEWIEPKHISNDERTSFIDHIPGGMIGLAVIAAALIAVAAAILIAARRRKSED